MITLRLRRPLAVGPLAVVLALGSAAPSDGVAVAGDLTAGAASLRGTVAYVQAPIAVVGRLRAAPASLRGALHAPSNRLATSSASAWQGLPPRNGVGMSAVWAPPRALEFFVGLPWARPEPLDVARAAAWQQGLPLDAGLALGWADDLTHHALSFAVPWQRLNATDVATTLAWGRFRELDASLTAPWRNPPPRDAAWWLGWRALHGGPDSSVAAAWFNPPTKDTKDWALPWGFGTPPAYRVRYTLPAVVEPAQRVVRSSYVCMDLKRPLQSALDVRLDLRRPLRTYCDTGSFIVNNSVDVITLADGLALPVTAVSVSTDINSFVWELRLTLPTLDGYNRVRPSPANDGAKEVQITINGYVWRGFVDTVSRNRDFGNDSYSAQGRSFTAYGATPFAPEKSTISPEDRLAQQLALEAFEYLDFNITWDAVDWVVPAGLFSYQNKDPMAALSQLCNAAGLVILPGRYDRSLVVRSRYPTTIWHWDDPATATGGHLPLNQMISGSTRFQAGNDLNKVFVSGTEVGNTLACTRDGTAGDRLAPAVVDALLATDAVATERGRVELCKGGARIFNSYVTPLVAATESGVRLRSVGELVAVDEEALDDFAYNGLITSLQVAAARTGRGELTVYQTLEVERYV